MSKSAIIATILVILFIVIGGVWYAKTSSSSSELVINNTTMTETSKPQSGVQLTKTNTISANGSVTVSNKDNSDANLDKDMISVDYQMSGLNSDSENTDQGLNNQNK